MFAEPALTAVNCGTVADWVCPAGTVTESGETFTAPPLLAKLTTSPPAPAGAESVTGKLIVCPAVICTAAGSPSAPVPTDVLTTTPKLALPACVDVTSIVADPAETPVTGTVTAVVVAANTNVCGTVATPGLLEVNVTVNPPCGAPPESDSRIFSVVVPVTANVGAGKLRPRPTRTTVRVGFRFTAATDTVTEPAFQPVIRACDCGVVWPSLKTTF